MWSGRAWYVYVEARGKRAETTGGDVDVHGHLDDVGCVERADIDVGCSHSQT